MREIKFRGKDINTGEWRYGFYVGETEKVGYIFSDYVVHSVLTETVGQFTEFYDTINIKIYDGDIVDCEDVDSFGVVYWDNDDARYCILFNGTIYDFGDFTSSEIEVISNIHDNPELLEGVLS